MNGLPYYKAYPRDFIEGTIGMPFEMKCAYRVVLDLIYMQGGQLPDDARYISGMLGCSVPRWKSVRKFLISAGKIQAKNGCLSNFRADKELESLAKLQNKQRENASQPRKNKDLQKPRPDHTEPEPDNTPLTPQGGAGQEVGRFSEFWEAFPHRGGVGQNRNVVLEKYSTAVRSGVSEALMIERARNYGVLCEKTDKIPRSATKWLNQEGWADEVTVARSQQPQQLTPEQLDARRVESIRSGKSYLCRDINHSEAMRLVSAGHVTADECRKVGIG